MNLILTFKSMKKNLLLFILFSSNISLFSQVLKGKIVDENNEALPNVTVYIAETASGIITDENGSFKTSINEGTYNIEFRLIGFKTEKKKIIVPKNGLDIQITLTEQPFQLNEVVVNPSNEDPAYEIMRNTVAQAPYHLHQLNSYTAEVYMKGVMKFEKMSSLMKVTDQYDNFNGLVDKTMVMESKSIVYFTAPNTYNQKVIAVQNSFPEQFSSGNGSPVSTSSIYASYYLGKVSPLSPQAFQYYKFKFKDVLENNGKQIFKIQFYPKLKSEQLSSGILYVVDENWSIYAAEFNIDEMGSKRNVKINYQEVIPSIYLPITYSSTNTINLFGFKANSHHFSSTQYSNVVLNPNAISAKANLNSIKIKNNLTKEETKVLDELDKIGSKEKLSTRDAVKLAILTQTLNKPTQTDSIKKQKSLEIKPYESPVKIEKDSLANSRDSVYWDNIRTIPLKNEEALSYKNVDSLPHFNNVDTANNSISIDANVNSKVAWLIGGKIRLNKSASLYYNGLLMGCLTEYNFVDGLWLGQDLSLQIKTTKNTIFKFKPSLYYTAARKSLVWDVNISQQYLPLLNGNFKISAGNTSYDIMQNKGENRWYNAAYAVWNGTNGISFYQKKYISAENNIDIANGLKFSLGGSYEQRHILQNKTTWNILGKDIEPNYSVITLGEFPDHTSTLLWSKLEWTPRYYYKIENGKKNYLFSRYPTFALKYSQAVPLQNNGLESDYSRLDFSVKQDIKIGLFNKIRYRINVGSFLTKNQLYAPDYGYFSTMPLIYSDHSFIDSYALLPNFTYINDSWWESHLTWSSEHILLKRIPALQNAFFSEALHLNTLWNYNGKIYNELGYSIGLSPEIRVGVFGSFNGTNFNSVGVKISLSISNLLKMK